MPTPLLVRRVAPTLLLALAATAAPVTGTASAADPTPASRAASWLADALTDAGTVVGSYPAPDDTPVTYTDYGRTADAAIALLAAGGHDALLGRTLTSLTSAEAVAAYTQGAPFDADDAAYAGATAKLAFVVEAAGGDATAVGGEDLLAQLLSLVTTSGRLADRSEFGDYANLFGHAFALLALDTAGRTAPQSLVSGLLAAQCADGSFPQAYTDAGETCTGSVDATGLVLQALAAVDLAASADAQEARTWLAAQQRQNGSFPGEAPVNSTGYAAAGLRAVGAGTATAEAYLASEQNPDGGLRRGDDGDQRDSDLFATAQALPALAGKTFAGAARTVAAQAVPCVTATATLAPTTITAGDEALLTLRATSGSTVDLFGYSRPSAEFEHVGSAVVPEDGMVPGYVDPTTNSRYYAQQRGCAAGPSTVLNVRTALTITAKRNGTRDYTFSGTSSPARAGGLVVSLYRVAPDGRHVLTAQTRADARTGKWSLRRVFSGTGRFGFVVRTGQDMVNAPGTSSVRSTVIH